MWVGKQCGRIRESDPGGQALLTERTVVIATLSQRGYRSNFDLRRKTVEKLQTNIYLVGFMGTGKTAVGKRLADSLGYDFIDSDAWIERESGISIPEIFAQSGESGFRDWEQRFIEDGHPTQRCVVSCGGGLIIPEGMLARVQSKGMVFCLFASPETILERTGRQSNRPLLQAENPEERIRALLKEREPVYLKAGTLIMTDGRPPGEIASHIERLYREQLRSSKARGSRESLYHS